MSDVKIQVYDGNYHDVDSSEMAFKIAGSMGFKEGAARANPVLLEPNRLPAVQAAQVPPQVANPKQAIKVP